MLIIDEHFSKDLGNLLLFKLNSDDIANMKIMKTSYNADAPT